MTPAHAHSSTSSTPRLRTFLGVEKSVRGRPWRDRLDERSTALSLAMAQQHGVPELLARILAGRGVQPHEVPTYLNPTVRQLMPDPHVLTAMPEAAARIADAVLRRER
ncbi:MAG TPA: single-stranded-DNA-specific exonuclease RecJ, partial [Xanthobacteraceae bacterium]|nr:single-stranded-DNA-specific exonuclease RecJ [Xanthobacteraceae bacterium]